MSKCILLNLLENKKKKIARYWKRYSNTNSNTSLIQQYLLSSMIMNLKFLFPLENLQEFEN